MVSNSLPLASIITPVYNGAKYLDQLIVCVRDQDYPAIEHIIDDDSTDDNATVAILNKYPRLRTYETLGMAVRSLKKLNIYKFLLLMGGIEYEMLWFLNFIRHVMHKVSL